MSALTTSRNTACLGNKKKLIPIPVAAATSIFYGGLVGINADGNAVPGQVFGSSPLTVIKIVGICGGALYGRPGQDAINQTSALIPGTNRAAGAAAAISTEVWEGAFLFDINSSSITKIQVGSLVYATDDHTVDDDSDTNARPVVGRCVGILSTTQCWVDITKKTAA